MLEKRKEGRSKAHNRSTSDTFWSVDSIEAKGTGDLTRG
jgi:hypothetical protein